MIPAVQDIAEAVDAAPDVPERQRDEVRGLAGDLIKEASCVDGLDLSLFAEAGLQLGCGCERPDTPARTCSADDSAWFDEVGIRSREQRDETRETEFFEQVAQVGQRIGECSSAIEQVVRSAEMAVGAVLEPARRMFDLAQRCGIKQLIEPAVEVIIEALRCAKQTTTDRNSVIANCLDVVAECVGEASAPQPAPPVEIDRAKVASSSVGTAAAGLNLSVDVGLKLGLDLDVALDCDAEEAEQECPPPAPEPEPAPEPASAPETPTGDGVIAPPPELSQVEEPAPPPKKLQNLDTQAASIGGDDPVAGDGAAGQDPWGIKKTGEW